MPVNTQQLPITPLKAGFTKLLKARHIPSTPVYVLLTSTEGGELSPALRIAR